MIWEEPPVCIEELSLGAQLTWMTDDDQKSASTDDEASSSRQETTAEYLIRACEQDLLPSNPLVRQQFGFSKVNDPEEETCLFGLYTALFLMLTYPPSADTVQQWVAKNELAKGICHTYEIHAGVSGYFDWFKKNQHVVDQNYVNPRGPWNPTGDSEIDTARLNALASSDQQE